MPKYQVEITDTYEKTFCYDIEAPNKDQAGDLAGEQHTTNDEQPTEDDFVEWNIDSIQEIK